MGAAKRGLPSPSPAACSAQKEAAGPGPGSTVAGIVALHRNRMFEWKPSAVVAIAPCPGAPLFAVGYECGSLELWDMLQLVCIQTVVGPSLEVTSLAWARDAFSSTWRTFVALLDGTVAEVLWRQAAVAHSTDSFGGVVWALAASPVSVVKPGFSHTLAAACDDGSVRLFGCEGDEPGLTLERVLCRLEGRLLAVTWLPGGTALAVGGSVGHVHVVDAVTGREHLRITVAAATVRPVTVWRLLALSDGSLVTGDSDGAVQFWDGRFGTLLHRSTQHRADVLALAATEDGETVFAAGIDSQIAMYTRTCKGGGGACAVTSWVYTAHKRPHTHDVRALAILAMSGCDEEQGSLLLSGGVDAQLMAYPAKKFLREHPHRLCKCPQRPICQVTTAAAAPPQRLMVAQHDTLDIWQLAKAALPRQGIGKYGLGGAPEGNPVQLLSAPRHLVRIRINGARVSTAAMAPSGKVVACTTPSGTRAYRLSPAASTVDIASSSATALVPERIKLPAAVAAAAVAVTVTDTHMVLSLRDGGLLCYSFADDEVAARHNLTASAAEVAAVVAASTTGATEARPQNLWRAYCPPAAQLLASSDGSLLAAVGSQGLSLYRLPDLQPHLRPLRVDSAVTSAAFSPDGCLIAATTSNCHLLVWETSAVTAATTTTALNDNISGGECTAVKWSLDNAAEITAAISRLPGTPTNISFRPASTPTTASGLPYRLVVNSPGGMVHFDLSRRVANTYLERKLDPAARRRLRASNRPELRTQPEDQPESRGSNGRVLRTMHPAVWVGYVGPADLLLLEKPWEEVLGALPPPLLTQRYGGG